MRTNIYLSEIGTSRNIIDCFTTQEGKIVSIETECIKYCNKSILSSYDNWATIKTNGYTVAAKFYLNLRLGKGFIILLKSNGVLHIFDNNLKIVDTLKTRISQRESKKTFFLIDDIHERLYINLSEDRIDCIEMAISNNQLTFVKSDNAVKLVYQLSSLIYFMDFAAHINAYTNEDFQTISLILKDRYSQRYTFRVIYVVNPSLRRSIKRWDILIPTIMHSLISDIDMAMDGATMLTIPNIGFFLCIKNKFKFLALPNGPQNVIDGSIINNFSEEFSLLSLDDIDVMETVNILGILNYEITEKYVCIKIATDNGRSYSFKMNKISEAEQKYIIYWSSIIKQEEDIVSKEYRTEKFKKIYTLSQTECIIEFVSGMLLYKNMFGQIVEQNISSGKVTDNIFSILLGTSVQRYLFTGLCRDKTAYVNFDSIPEDTLFDYQIISSPPTIITEIWPEKSHIYWRDEDGAIFCDGKYTNETTKFISIVANGTIISDKKYIALCNIMNNSQHYVSLSKHGILAWSNSGIKLELMKTSANDPLYCIMYSVTFGYNNVTVIATEDKLTVVEDYGKKIRSKKLSNLLNIVSTITIVSQEFCTHIILGDVQGQLCILDFKTLAVIDVIKIAIGKIRVCSTSERSRILIYSDETLTLLEYESEDVYRLLPIDITHSIKLIQKDLYDDQLYFVNSENVLFRLKPKVKSRIRRQLVGITNKYLINKMIALTNSMKYSVGCYIEYEKSKVKSSGICLYDLNSRIIKDTFSITDWHPQVSISDISDIAFDLNKNIKTSLGAKMEFAKQLVLNQCVALSLDYETAEDENSDNLLLFSIDEEKGKINLEMQINTGYTITSLFNYYNEYFLVAGDKLEIFRLGYLVKEHKFLIESASEALLINGYISKVFNLPDYVSPTDAENQTLKKRRLNKNYLGRLICLDLYRGFKEIDVYQEVVTKGGFQLEYVPNSERHPVTKDIMLHYPVTDFGYVRIGGEKWFLVCLGSSRIRIYHVSIDDEYEMTEFRLPYRVTNVIPVQERESKMRRETVTLFTIATANNGHYFLGTILSQPCIDTVVTPCNKTRLSEQMSLISYDEEEDHTDDEDEDGENHESGILFIDNRVLGKAELSNIY